MGCTLHFNVKGMLQAFTQVYDSVPHGTWSFGCICNQPQNHTGEFLGTDVAGAASKAHTWHIHRPRVQ